MFPPVSPAGAVKSDAGRRSNKKVQENATTKTYNKSAKTKRKATTETDEKATNTIIKGERQNKTHTTKTIYKTRTNTIRQTPNEQNNTANDQRQNQEGTGCLPWRGQNCAAGAPSCIGESPSGASFVRKVRTYMANSETTLETKPRIVKNQCLEIQRSTLTSLN